MTNHSQAADVGELSQAVASLTEALARTEKRSAHLTRIIHWGLLGGLVLLVMAGFLIANGVGAAYAFLSDVEEVMRRNEDVRGHVELSIKKTIVENNLEERERQMTPEKYRVFVDNLALGEYKAFVNNLTQEEYDAFFDKLALEMTLEEYKTFFDKLALEMTLEEYKTFVRKLMLGVTPEKLKILLVEVETLVHTLPPEKYKTLLVGMLVHTLPPEKHRILFVETLARILPPERYKALLVEALARVLPSERYKALLVGALPPEKYPKRYKALLVDTLPSERYKALLVETLVHTLSPEEYEAVVDSLPPEVHKAIAREVVIERTIETFADAYAVVANVRDDSDAVHGILVEVFDKLSEDPGKTFDNIGRQLQTMNKALAAMPPMKKHMEQMSRKMSSIPAMAAQMDLMNRNIASMTTSMGSSMGRMGKWMPW